MSRARYIPVLLVRGGSLVKSVRFKDHAYIGDPVNAVRIFSEMQADELIVLDIDAYREGRTLSGPLLSDIACEATMPLAVGGGIRTIAQVHDLVSAGVEKVVIGAHAAVEPGFVRAAALEVGSAAVSVCIDVKRTLLGNDRVWTVNGTRRTNWTAVEFARAMQDQGAGEIVVQSIDCDGRMQGYDLALVRAVAESVTVPVVALGGAGKPGDFAAALGQGLASAVAAGSAFVYLRERGCVLINYPQLGEREY